MPAKRKTRNVPLRFVIIPLVILSLVAFTKIFGLIVLVISFGIIALAALIWAEIKTMPPLVEYEDGYGNRRVGSFDEVANWQRLDDAGEIPGTLMNRVKSAIEEFRPAIRYDSELGYNAELVGFLKSRFPSLKMEEEIGSSRPDIVIGDVAIEVKGPTGNMALDSLTTKCLKYLQHYPHLIAVLFEPFFNEGHFHEIESGLKIKFPNLVIIRKPNYFVYQRNSSTKI